MQVDQQNEVKQPVRNEEPKLPEHHPQRRSSRRWWILVLALAAVAALVISGILPRIHARADLDKETAEMAIPTVSVVQPKRGQPAQEVVLPANVQAYIDAPIYARTNGYLKHWYVDIGAHVKAGQLLAEIETPEFCLHPMGWRRAARLSASIVAGDAFASVFVSGPSIANRPTANVDFKAYARSFTWTCIFGTTVPPHR